MSCTSWGLSRCFGATTRQRRRRLYAVALEGSRAKSRRAKQHRDALDKSVRAFFKKKPYRIRVESDLQRGHHIVRLVNTPPRPPSKEWALIIGDCAHAMRSAFDYITWECSYGRGDRRTAYPICRSEREFDGVAKRKLRHLSPRMRAAIKSAQPYHAPNPTLTNLWLIETLDNADKHRLLTVTVSVQHSLDASFALPIGFIGVFNPSPRLFPNVQLKRNAMLAKITTPPYVKMRANFTPAIAFGEGVGFGGRAYAVDSLRDALANLNSLLASFRIVLANDPGAR
jgi:hypothetical protein